MDAITQNNFEIVLREGIRAVKSGDYETARKLLNQAAHIKTTDARPWLWLADTTEDPRQKQDYLESAVAADPSNRLARRALALFIGKIFPSNILQEGEGVHIQPREDLLETQTKNAFICPQCGASLSFNTHTKSQECRYCGYTHKIEQIPAADSSEQVLDFTLPTIKGHTWAENAQRYACTQCGAVSLWQAGETAIVCPYCGSNQLIESTETAAMIEPHAIGFMRFDEQEVSAIFLHWLEKDWFIPDDLLESAKGLQLRPAYIPFWTFDGTMEFKWSCQINEGTSNYPAWISRSGIDYELFDDELIPAIKDSISAKIDNVLPFYLKEVVQFKPEFLAGWASLTYQVSLSDASLKARERVVHRVKRQIEQRVAPNEEKKDLIFYPLNWLDTTFKLVLLPLWFGNYKYKGKTYQFTINGQSGKISGEKPKDKVKTAAIALNIGLTILFLFALLLIIGSYLGWY